MSDPAVIAAFRLAISEVVHGTEVARALDSTGREASRAALGQIMAGAQASGLLIGRSSELAGQFAGLLWRDLLVSLRSASPSDRPSATGSTVQDQQLMAEGEYLGLERSPTSNVFPNRRKQQENHRGHDTLNLPRQSSKCNWLNKNGVFGMDTLRREYLDRTLFSSTTDLEAKLLGFQHYYYVSTERTPDAKGSRR